MSSTFSFGTALGFPLALLRVLQWVVMALRYTGGRAWGEKTEALKYASTSHIRTFAGRVPPIEHSRRDSWTRQGEPSLVKLGDQKGRTPLNHKDKTTHRYTTLRTAAIQVENGDFREQYGCYWPSKFNLYECLWDSPGLPTIWVSPEGCV